MIEGKGRKKKIVEGRQSIFACRQRADSLSGIMANPLLGRVVWLVSLLLAGTKSAAFHIAATPRLSDASSTARMSSTITTSSFDESVESREQPLQRRVEVEEKFAR